VTNQDYIEVVSTFNVMTTPMYRCDDCKLKYKTEPDRREKLEQSMACKYYADKPRHAYKGEYNNKDNPKINYNNCVGNHFYAYWTTFINFYPQYEKGIYPYPGKLFDQPAKFVDLMQLVHNLINEKDLKAQNLAKRQAIPQGKVNGRRPSKR